MNLRIIDWIWHVRGSIALAPGQSDGEAFDRLTPLFQQSGTSHERMGDTLTFRKQAQAPQDRMSIFDGGVLRIERSMAGAVLRYHLTSRALMLCFLAPFLFLAFAQLTIAMGALQKPPTAAEKKAAEAKKKAKEDIVHPLNPIDKALGAPEPEKPKKDEKGKGKDKDKDQDKPSPTPAYVFAAMFATLYVIGRILEDRLIRSLFRRKLTGA